MSAKRTRTSVAGRLAVAGIVGAAIFACFAPTQLVLRFETNLQSRAPQTAIQVATETAYKQGAAANGHIGELVVVPSDAHDALVEVKVALGIDGTDPNTCFTTPGNPRCVTAKRSYRFADHETRTFDLYLSSACLGVACGPGQSCSAQTSACVDIRENETDPVPTAPPTPVVDGGGDALPADAAPDVDPVTDGSVGPCGPTGVAALGRDAPVTLVGTADALYWKTANGQLIRRAKTSAGPGLAVANDVETVAAVGTTVAWTRGTTVFGRTANGAVASCTLSEAARSLAFRAGAQPTDLPSAMFVSGASFMRRYTAPSSNGEPCVAGAAFPSAPQDEIAVTTDWLWARAVTVNNPVAGTPWNFVENGGWNVSFPTTKNILLAADRNVAVAVTVNAAGDTIFYRLVNVTQIAAFLTRAGSPTITGLAVDGAYVYWLETVGAASRLYRASLVAPGPDPDVVAITSFPQQVAAQGLVVDNTCIFTWAGSSNVVDPSGSIIGLSKNP